MPIPPWVRLRLSGAVLLTALCAGPPQLQGQVLERQVPVLPAQSITEISPEIRRDLELFPEVEGFLAARLFSLQGGGWILEISARREGTLVRERRTLSESALRELRGDLEARIAGRGGDVVRTREGRGGLVLGQTLLGLGFYGWAVPVALDVDSSRGVAAAYLLTAGASFLIPYQLTRRASVSEVHRNLTLYGATRGGAYGATLAGLILGRDEDSSDTWERLHFGLAVVGSVAGAFTGYRVADRTRTDEGTAALWGVLGDYGLLWGFGSAYAGGLYDETVTRDPADNPIGSEREHLRWGHAAALAGAGLGLWAGRRLGSSEAYTVGDATVLRSGGILGAQLALPVANAVGSEDGETYAGAAVLGSVLGLGISNRLLRPESLSGGSGLLVAAGQLAGGLLGAGVTYLLDGGDADELAYLTTSALGSLAGFALTFRAVRDRPGADGTRPGALGRLELHPEGLLLGLAAPPTGPGDRPLAAPLVTLRF